MRQFTFTAHVQTRGVMKHVPVWSEQHVATRVVTMMLEPYTKEPMLAVSPVPHDQRAELMGKVGVEAEEL